MGYGDQTSSPSCGFEAGLGGHMPSVPPHYVLGSGFARVGGVLDRAQIMFRLTLIHFSGGRRKSVVREGVLRC